MLGEIRTLAGQGSEKSDLIRSKLDFEQEVDVQKFLTT